MLKRLIEVALPLKEVSEESACEKSIRDGHIQTLHVWWARRPLAACRAVVFASLIPDPDDPECPDSFRTLVNDLLPRMPDGEDTPRSRCLEFIKHLVKWENSNNDEIIGKARKLIAAAHKFLHPDAEGDSPKVLDPFAGDGAIPLEALRLGCEAHAIDLNPVAHLIELCTLVYPQKYGKPNSRPTPDYIKKLDVAHKGENGEGLFSKNDGKSNASGAAEIDGIVLTRLPLITEAEYRKNPLASDVRFWGRWLLERTRDQVGWVYPTEADGQEPMAYVWARTVNCPNPACGGTIPLLPQLWLCKKARRTVALRIVSEGDVHRECVFRVTEDKDIDFDPDEGTMQRGQAACPFCQATCSSKYLQAEGNAGRVGQHLLAVVARSAKHKGKTYRAGNEGDERLFAKVRESLSLSKEKFGADIVPDEPLIAWSGVFNAPLFGFTTWGDLFNDRQALVLTTFYSNARRLVGVLRENLRDAGTGSAEEYVAAVLCLLSIALGRLLTRASNMCVWHHGSEGVEKIFGFQALPMQWKYAEGNVFTDQTVAGFFPNVESVASVIERHSGLNAGAAVVQGSATGVASADCVFDAIITDPPYYDAVPYSDLSDFFYVWLKRGLGDVCGEMLRTPLTPKRQELVSHLGKNYPGQRKTDQDYEEGMAAAFRETHRIMSEAGIACIMFAHKTTSAWESIIAALVRSGMSVTSSWPIHTEMTSRLRGKTSAALASSVTLVCRKRLATAGEGYWDDVRDELRGVARERLDFFWQQGIRGADFFISAIGPALSVYGRYAKVTRLTGEEVSVGQFLDEVRGIVTDYALSQILHGVKTGQIDPETRFHVLWKWSYGDGKVPADEAFKLAQALGIPTETMWDKTGVLEKAGENVLALPIAKRMRIKDLGDPNVDGSPASMIDVLHRCCGYRDRGDTAGLAEFLARSGHAKSEKLWTVAQAISEVLPDGDKEKQLLQGLLNQRDKVEEEMKEGRLF